MATFWKTYKRDGDLLSIVETPPPGHLAAELDAILASDPRQHYVEHLKKKKKGNHVQHDEVSDGPICTKGVRNECAVWHPGRNYLGCDCPAIETRR